MTMRINNALRVLLGLADVVDESVIDLTNCTHRFGKWYTLGGSIQYRNCIDCNFEQSKDRFE
jgi:hypothetical protein